MLPVVGNVATLLVTIGTKLRLLPGDRLLTLTDRNRNAACAIAGTALYAAFFVLDQVLRYMSAP